MLRGPDHIAIRTTRDGGSARKVSSGLRSGAVRLKSAHVRVTGRRFHDPQAQRPAWPVRGRPIVQHPLDARAVAGPVRRSHPGAVGALVDKGHPSREQQQGHHEPDPEDPGPQGEGFHEWNRVGAGTLNSCRAPEPRESRAGHG